MSSKDGRFLVGRKGQVRKASLETKGRKTIGEETKQFGSAWYLVNAGGKPIEHRSASTSNSNSDTNGRGGGY